MSYPLYPSDPNRDPADPFRNLDPSPTTRPVMTLEPRSDTWDEVDAPRLTTEEVIERQREQFGGLKIGSAFFGWLTATGIAAILAALIVATGAALGFGVEDAEAAAGEIGLSADAILWIGAGALLLILFLAYYCGGYVAGRLARFNGIKQGIAVCAWALAIAIVVAIVSVVLGTRYDVLSYLDAVPRIPIPEGALTIAAIVAGVAVALGSLGGAILGGMAGVRYHRRVDHVGLDG